MNKAQLKGICVGAGYFSRFQYEAWQRIPQVQIAAICNRSIEPARAIASEFNIPVVSSIDDFEKLLDTEQPDFVDIITPPETHLELCALAATRGIAIICQKPLAPDWQQTLALADIIRKSSSRFMVHENWRWQPWYQEIKKFMQTDSLGTFFHCSVQSRLGDGWGDDAYLRRQPFFRNYPRLLIFENGVHFLDTFRFLFGEVKSVYTQIARRNPVICGEDSALIVCEFENGGTAVLDASRYNEADTEDPRFTFGSARIDGSKGHIELDTEGCLRFKPLGMPYQKFDFHPPRRGFCGDCVHAIQEHFVDCMLNNKPFSSTIDDYLRSVILVEAAYASAKAGQVIPISGFDPTAQR